MLWRVHMNGKSYISIVFTVDVYTSHTILALIIKPKLFMSEFIQTCVLDSIMLFHCEAGEMHVFQELLSGFTTIEAMHNGNLPERVL